MGPRLTIITKERQAYTYTNTVKQPYGPHIVTLQIQSFLQILSLILLIGTYYKKSLPWYSIILISFFIPLHIYIHICMYDISWSLSLPII